MAITSIILLAVAASLMIASRAIPTSQNRTRKITNAARVLQKLADELDSAFYITNRSANAITFTVADRNSDGAPEVIRYKWPGLSGHTITRQYNADTAVTMLDDVHQFDLDYETKTVTEQYPGPLKETAELLLSAHDSGDTWANIDSNSTEPAQHFVPTSLPARAISWKVTRVLIQAMQDGPADSQTRVQLRVPKTNNLPSDTVIAEYIQDESDLGSRFAWIEIPFEDHVPQIPGNGLCLMLVHNGGGDSMRYIFDSSSGSGLASKEYRQAWTYSNTKALNHYIYGVASLPPDPQMATRRFVTRIRLKLQVDGDTALQHETAIRMLNTPEVLTALWESDFSQDPTALDINSNSQPDWDIVGGGTFNGATLVDSVWQADAELHTRPDHDFDDLTTVDVKYRDVTVGGPGAVLKIRVDRTGHKHAVIRSKLILQSDGTQTLFINTKPPLSKHKQFVEVSGLTSDFIRLRLLVDPVLDTVNVTVNGKDRGTYSYQRIIASAKHGMSLYPNDTEYGAEFDYVRICVGGTGGRINANSSPITVKPTPTFGDVSTTSRPMPSS